MVHFTKHYLDGKWVLMMGDEMIADAAVDPWEWAESMLDEMARRQHARNRDGTPV